MERFRQSADENYVWCERLQGVAVIDKETCKQYMCTGPVIRAAGIPYDIRKVYPYLGYENYQFDIPTQTEGDAYARYLSAWKRCGKALL